MSSYSLMKVVYAQIGLSSFVCEHVALILTSVRKRNIYSALFFSFFIFEKGG